MALRGRGCLEVRKSENPFFQTCSAEFGLTAEEVQSTTWKVNGSPPKFSSAQHKVDGNFAFLYTRESDRIGEKVPKPTVGMSTAKMLSRTEFLRQRRERAIASGDVSDEMVDDAHIQAAKPNRIDPEEYLRVYEHHSKEEDPRYFTTTNEYGKKAPSVATVVTERMAKKQNFSKSFQNIKPKNTSLNTALTKSNVHRSLDPQFA